MSDRVRIWGGAALALAVLSFPAWRGATSPDPGARPDLPLPDSAACVEDGAWMSAHHMDLLAEWREAVVRGEGTSHTSPDGSVRAMSLTGTCLKCHDDRDAFCTECHSYAGVAPKCWDCHVGGEGEG